MPLGVSVPCGASSDDFSLAAAAAAARKKESLGVALAEAVGFCCSSNEGGAGWRGGRRAGVGSCAATSRRAAESIQQNAVACAVS